MIKELHQKLVSGATTSKKLTEGYFETIEKKDKEIFSYLTLTKDLAYEAAQKTDEKIKKGEEIGMLEGIPGAIKDVICTQGIRTTAASKILDNYIPPYDATVISKLKEAGAVILGKTNLDEFAMGSSTENSAYGPTKNPHDLERVPGGSSGGSAAAVAADEAVWALGSDTGGSVRQPASFCGIVGFKPTYGRVSRNGLLAMASSFDQIGTLTKSTEDAAILLSVIAGHDKMDATSAPDFGKKYEDYLDGNAGGIKIGVVKKYLENLDEKMKGSLEKALEKFQKIGAQIVEIELPYADYSLPAYYIIQPSETSSNLARYDGVKYGFRADDKEGSNLFETYLDSRKYALGAEVKRRIMLGTYALSSGYYEAYYGRAQKIRSLVRNDFKKALEKVNIIFTPTAPTPAFKIGEKTDNPLEMYLADIFTISANIAGIPAISVPAEPVEVEGKKLPIGFQLLGKWFDEEKILRVADAWEKN